MGDCVSRRVGLRLNVVLSESVQEEYRDMLLLEDAVGGGVAVGVVVKDSNSDSERLDAFESVKEVVVECEYHLVCDALIDGERETINVAALADMDGEMDNERRVN